MRLTKFIELCVEIPDPIDFAADFDANLLALVRRKYEGLCFSGAFVERIAAVAKHGELQLDKKQHRAGGRVNLLAEADVLVFPPGSVVNGCARIREMPALNALLCRAGETTTLFVANTRGYGSLAAAEFSAVVTMAAYPPFSRVFTLNAVPFAFAFACAAVFVDARANDAATAATAATIAATAAALARLADQQAALAAAQADRPRPVEFFTRLFYAYRRDVPAGLPAGFSLPAGAAVLALADIAARRLVGWAVRDPRIDLVGDRVLFFEAAAEGADTRADTRADPPGAPVGPDQAAQLLADVVASETGASPHPLVPFRDLLGPGAGASGAVRDAGDGVFYVVARVAHTPAHADALSELALQCCTYTNMAVEYSERYTQTDVMKRQAPLFKIIETMKR